MRKKLSAIVEVGTKFAEARLFIRAPHVDSRGSFQRVFSRSEYVPIGLTDTFVEDNVSVSARGVLRGLHFDVRLAKFVQVLAGEVFDAIVDVRDGSPTYGTWDAFRLTAAGGEQLYVPRGFAHGFYVLTDTAVVSYKQTAAYDPSTEGQLIWDDPAVGIDWPFQGMRPHLSEKDRSAPALTALSPIRV